MGIKECIMEDIFTNIYKKKTWGKGSGTGSKLSNDNLKYIELLKSIITKYNITTICDIGCGDWEFSKHINYDKMNIEYTGIDCVEHIIKENDKLYSGDNITFIHKSISKDYIPSGYDLIIIKDLIQHWDDETILSFLGKLISKNKYVFSTNGYKFMRDPSKNSLKKRDINNKYRYFPVSINKYHLKKFKSKSIMVSEHRAKQMILFTDCNKCLKDNDDDSN